MVNDHAQAPLPSRAQLQEWLHALADCVAAGNYGHEELVDLLAQARRTSRDLGWVADHLALLARENGASFPDLAAAWSTSGRRELVNGPRTRIHRLTDRFGTAEELLATIDRLDHDTDHAAPGRER